MKVDEQAFVFECDADELVAVIHRPEKPRSRGVLIVVGGPQYRVGSHRQFLLLARALASNGVPVMRFDYRGMGDSTGDLRSFEYIAEDIRAAIDVFFQKYSCLHDVTLWGLCDAASASVFYAHTDPRVGGLVLLNPWIRTEQGEAKAILRHYYIKRLFDRGLWVKILGGKFSIKASLCSLFGLMRATDAGDKQNDARDVNLPVLPERVLDGLNMFNGQTGIILSGNDLTAAEFKDAMSESPKWNKLMQQKEIQCRAVEEANHTFSRSIWRDQVTNWTLEWLES